MTDFPYLWPQSFQYFSQSVAQNITGITGNLRRQLEDPAPSYPNYPTDSSSSAGLAFGLGCMGLTVLIVMALCLRCYCKNRAEVDTQPGLALVTNLLTKEEKEKEKKAAREASLRDIQENPGNTDNPFYTACG